MKDIKDNMRINDRMHYFLIDLLIWESLLLHHWCWLFKIFYYLYKEDHLKKKKCLKSILRTTGYTNKEMLKYKKEKQRGKLFIKQIKKKKLLLIINS